MTLLASTLTDYAAHILHDDDHDRFSVARLLSYLNAAQRQLMSVRPEANAVYSVLTLQQGILQQIPSALNPLRLLTITRNMGADGATPGKAAAATDRSSLDSLLISWDTGETVTEIESYVYDERTPVNFFVYKPPDGVNVVTVEALVSVMPDDITDVSESLVFLDTYFSPLIHWMLYCAYTMELDDSASYSKALHHYQCFALELGQDLSAATLVNPNLFEFYMTRNTG